MILAHRIQLNPTAKQLEYFVRACGTARFVWNWALASWDAEYKAGRRPNAFSLKRQFNAIKYEQFPWLNGIHRDAHAQPFTALAKAFKNFFNGKARYPRFKKKGKCQDSFYAANDTFSVDGASVRLPVIGWVRMTESLRLSGKIQSAIVSREVDRWFVSISVNVTASPQSVPAGAPIGVDLGIATFATLSTGEKIASPRPLRQALRKLRRLGRWHSRKRPKSRNRAKSAMRLAKCYRRIRNARKDFLHKLSTDFAKNHSVIGIEDLNVQGMVKNPKLARYISDSAWSEFRRQLEYKTALYGSRLVVYSRFYASSKLCSVCGAKAASMPLRVRSWACGECGTLHDRDINAAINLKPTTVGYTGSNACGEVGAVRPLVETGTLPRTRAQKEG